MAERSAVASSRTTRGAYAWRITTASCRHGPRRLGCGTAWAREFPGGYPGNAYEAYEDCWPVPGYVIAAEGSVTSAAIAFRRETNRAIVASGGRLSVSGCSRSAPLRVMCNGRHNLMSKIIRRREDMVGHRCSCMCNGYLQQKGRSVEHFCSISWPRSEVSLSELSAYLQN
jgi:hypothetical protein